ALAEPLAAGDVRGKVPVPESEPLGLDPQVRELPLDDVGLLLPTPALALVHHTAEGVQDGVQVGADAQAEQADVVAGVADDDDLRLLVTARLAQLVDQAPDEPRTAHSTGQRGDPHVMNLMRESSHPAVILPHRSPNAISIAVHRARSAAFSRRGLDVSA